MVLVGFCRQKTIGERVIESTLQQQPATDKTMTAQKNCATEVHCGPLLPGIRIFL
jgi:hypothetical protein